VTIDWWGELGAHCCRAVGRLSVRHRKCELVDEGLFRRQASSPQASVSSPSRVAQSGGLFQLRRSLNRFRLIRCEPGSRCYDVTCSAAGQHRTLVQLLCLSLCLSVSVSVSVSLSLSLSVYSMRCIVDASCSASTLPSSFTSWTQYYNNTTIACLLIMLYRTSRLWSSSDIGHSRSVNTSWSILSKNLTTKDMYVNSSRHVSPEIWRTAVELKSMCIHSDRDIWNLNTIIEIRREKNTVLVSLSNKWRRLVDCAVSSQQKHHIARNDLRCVCLVSRTNAQNENTYIKTKQVTNCVYDLSGH